MKRKISWMKHPKEKQITDVLRLISHGDTLQDAIRGVGITRGQRQHYTLTLGGLKRAYEGAKKRQELKEPKKLMRKIKPILEEVKIPPCEPMTCKSKKEHYFSVRDLMVGILIGIIGGITIGIVGGFIVGLVSIAH